jgi:hypothetical protein
MIKKSLAAVAPTKGAGNRHGLSRKKFQEFREKSIV